MAEDLSNRPAAAAAVVAAPDLPPAGGRRASRHRRRFSAAFVALGVVVAVSGVLTWLLLAGVDRPKAFSSFSPKGSDPVERVQEVADYVAARYVAASGLPVVTVTAGEDDSPSQPGATQIVSIESNPPGVSSFEQGNIIFFRMCAAGASCGLRPGDNPDVYYAILASEAHELALRAFDALADPAFVMVILPPGLLTGPNPAQIPRAVSFCRRTDLKAELDRPLTDTIPDPPPTPEAIAPGQIAEIQRRERAAFYQLKGSGPDPTNTSRIYVLSR